MKTLDAFDAFEHTMWLWDIEDAKSRLQLLSVGELRVLYRHYLKHDDGLKKADMIDVLAPELVADER
jgi:hypothetical protein